MTPERLAAIRALDTRTATHEQTRTALHELADEVQHFHARIADLEEDSAVLHALQAHGVDNWDGYDDALSSAS